MKKAHFLNRESISYFLKQAITAPILAPPIAKTPAIQGTQSGTTPPAQAPMQVVATILATTKSIKSTLERQSATAAMPRVCIILLPKGRF